MSEEHKNTEPDKGEEGRIYQNNRELFYSFDPTNHYSKKVDYQYEGNQRIIKQSWDVARERVEEAIVKIKAGELSPIAFYMEKNLMELPMLSDYADLPKRKVRKHLTPSGFNKLDEKMLAMYARIFSITIDELKNPDYNQTIGL